MIPDIVFSGIVFFAFLYFCFGVVSAIVFLEKAIREESKNKTVYLIIGSLAMLFFWFALLDVIIDE